MSFLVIQYSTSHFLKFFKVYNVKRMKNFQLHGKQQLHYILQVTIAFAKGFDLKRRNGCKEMINKSIVAPDNGTSASKAHMT